MKERRPYVITAEEFEENEQYSNISLTYYSKSNELADDGDELLSRENVEEMVGWENLKKFGVKSNDPNIVFVRNERMEADYEIAKTPETYTEAQNRAGRRR